MNRLKPQHKTQKIYYIALGLYMMSLPHFITGYNHLDNAVANTEDPTDLDAEGLCGSNYHLNSLEAGCAQVT